MHLLSNLFCEVYQFLLEQSPKTTSWCCHSCKLHLFFFFQASDWRTFLQKVRPLSTCAATNSSLGFCGGFGPEATAFLSSLSAYINIALSVFISEYRYFCTRVFTRSSTRYQTAFISRRQYTSPSWVLWWLCCFMVVILAQYCLYRWTWHLQAFRNRSQGWIRLVKVQNCFSFWGLGWFHLILCQRQQGWRLVLNTSPGTPSVASYDVG